MGRLAKRDACGRGLLARRGPDRFLGSIRRWRSARLGARVRVYDKSQTGDRLRQHWPMPTADAGSMADVLQPAWAMSDMKKQGFPT